MLSGVYHAAVGAVSHAFKAAKSDPIVQLDQLGCRGVPATNAFYALMAYGLYCHRNKNEVRLPPEKMGEIIESLKKELPQKREELNALIFRSNNKQTSRGLCYEFDQIQLEDGESFPFKVKFTSSTVQVSGLEEGVAERVIKAYLALDGRIDKYNALPLPWDLVTLQRLYCFYAFKLVERGRCGVFITRSKEEIHELIIDIENNPQGYSLFPKEEDKGKSKFAMDLQEGGCHDRSGEYYDYIWGRKMDFNVKEDGSINYPTENDWRQSNEVFAALSKPKKEYSQEFPLGKETLSFANSLYACYILAYFIHYENDFIGDNLKIVPEELSEMGEIIKRNPYEDYHPALSWEKRVLRKAALKTLDEFLEAFTKEAGFKDGAWVIDKLEPVVLNLVIKEGVLNTKEFDKKYGHGASERALKTYQAFPVEQRLDVSNESPVPLHRLPGGPLASELQKAAPQKPPEMPIHIGIQALSMLYGGPYSLRGEKKEEKDNLT